MNGNNKEGLIKGVPGGTEIVPGVWEKGDAIFGDYDQVVGCSLHLETNLIHHSVADGDATVHWCQPHDGSDPHILIGRSYSGRMPPRELEKYAGSKPKPFGAQNERRTNHTTNGLPHAPWPPREGTSRQ
jgi:hypothetical protein